VLVLDGLHIADGLPFALEHRVISLTAAPEAVTADFPRKPRWMLLGHIPWTQARHRISAHGAGTKIAGRLGISRDARLPADRTLDLARRAGRHLRAAWFSGRPLRIDRGFQTLALAQLYRLAHRPPSPMIS